MTLSVRLARRLEFPEGLLAALAHDPVHQHGRDAHLLLDIPTQLGVGFLDLLWADPLTLVTHRAGGED